MRGENVKNFEAIDATCGVTDSQQAVFTFALVGGSEYQTVSVSLSRAVAEKLAKRIGVALNLPLPPIVRH